MRVLIDLNVILDVEQNRVPFVQDSALVVDQVIQRQIEGMLPPHCFATLFYLLRKFTDIDTAHRSIAWHLKHFKACTCDHELLASASTGPIRDFEDALVAASATRHECAYIITRNITDFSQSDVPAITPTDFLALRSKHD